MTGKNLYVLGAGAWGTALAISAARSCSSHVVWLCARKPEHERAMTQERENQRYLPGHRFPVSLHILEADFMGIAYRATAEDLVIIATPMAALRGALSAFAHSSAPVIWLCKGFEQVQLGAAHGLLGHEIQAEIAPHLRTGILSGPSFAQEVAAGQPTALVAASPHPDLCQTLVSCLHGSSLRIYANDDVAGVEVGGAVKNVLAIAAGLCDGMQLGMNARAALITRGLAEMTRLGLALSARSDTFMGLSGLGDLVLTATGDLSRNRKVGQLLASGLGLQEAVASLGHVAEGVYSAKTVLNRAQMVDVDMPITHAVVDLLEGRLPAHEAVRHLMGRQARAEPLA